jgi:hypothetical protein
VTSEEDLGAEETLTEIRCSPLFERGSGG